MENALFALFMLGCGQNLDVCRVVPAPVELHQTSQSCYAAFEAVARQTTDFPTTVGHCVPIRQSTLETDVVFEWFFAANGTLVVEPVYRADGDTIVADTYGVNDDQQS